MYYKSFMLGANHRIATLCFIGIITYMAALGLPKLTIDTSFNDLIPASSPDRHIYNKIAKEFGSDNRTIIYVKDESLWSPDKLAALEKLHYDVLKLNFVDDVQDLFTLRNLRGRQGEITSRLFLPDAPKDQASTDIAKKDALYNPLLAKNFISSDGNATALVVIIKESNNAPNFDLEANNALNEIVAQYESSFDELFQIGPSRINAELKSSLFKDLIFLGPLSACILVVTILLLLRSWFGAIVPLITSGLSIVWALGLMGWIGMPLNILSSMLPSLVMVIGSTEDTHMLSTYFAGLGLEDDSLETSDKKFIHATRFMVKHMGIPVFLTIITTALGFASNLFSNIQMIQDFALASTFAIIANGIITFLLVPLMLATFKPEAPQHLKKGGNITGIPGIFVRLFNYSNKNFPRLVLFTTAVLCAFFIYHASKLHVTNDPLSYFHSNQPIIKDINRLHADLSGLKTFYITLESDQNKAFQMPANLQKLVEIQNFMENQGIFDRSISLADYISLANQEFNNGNPKYHEIPPNREMIAQYLLFFHRTDIKNYVSNDFNRANIVVRHNVSDSNTLNKYIRELKDVVSEIAGTQMSGHVVGENIMINAATESLMLGQIKSLAILLGVIFVIMSGLFLSFKGGTISLIPNLIPIILMFGIMGYLKIPLNPGTAMVAVIAIGIAIDGTIHLLTRYNDLCRKTLDFKEAVNQTVQEEATPMVVTSLALALGFGILLFSNFTVIAQFGALSAATILFALCANLLVTPIIISRYHLVGLYQILSMTMDSEVLEKSPLFQGMSNYQMRKAILISELNEFIEGELLVEQGTFGRSMYLLLSGTVDVSRRSKFKSTHLATLKAGQIFGEVGYVKAIQRTADVQALSKVRALRFDRKRLKKDLKFFPNTVAKLNFNISCILGERLAEVVGGITEEKDADP